MKSQNSYDKAHCKPITNSDIVGYKLSYLGGFLKKSALLYVPHLSLLLSLSPSGYIGPPHSPLASDTPTGLPTAQTTATTNTHPGFDADSGTPGAARKVLAQGRTGERASAGWSLMEFE